MANPEHVEIVKQGEDAIDTWRIENPDVQLDLIQADLDGTFLYGAHLENAVLAHANLKNADLTCVSLESADLSGAHLENTELTSAELKNAILQDTHLEYTTLHEANLENADLCNAYLENARLGDTRCENTKFWHAHLENANFYEAHLENADLRWAHLENANLWRANLKSANLEKAYLANANFRGVHVNAETNLMGCTINRNTDLRDVPLDVIRIEATTRVLLRYNARRMAWEDWYKDKKVFAFRRVLRKQTVGRFWGWSDYGRSAKRLIATFTLYSFLFAALYFCAALYGLAMRPELVEEATREGAMSAHPGIIADLMPRGSIVPLGELPAAAYLMLGCRSLYFSVVTMTTLGFGDLHADPESFLGHFVLILHVLLGYVLLGSLITVLTTYLTGDCALASFSDESKMRENQ